MIIQKVGIIGAGTMGNGIAQACAVVGIPVVMVDISEAAVAKGIATVSGSLDRLLKKHGYCQPQPCPPIQDKSLAGALTNLLRSPRPH